MDEKKTIVLMNKGKRPWTLTDAFGVKKTIDSLEKIELDEAKALQLLLDYPRDFIKASEAGASTKDIARMEQSLRDRSKNLDEREAALVEREKAVEAKNINPIAAAIEAIAPFLSDIGTKYLAETDEAWADGVSKMKSDEKAPAASAKPRGRPAKPAADKGDSDKAE